MTMGGMTTHAELRWVRTQLRALAFSRTNGHWLSPADQEHYLRLCQRERELLELADA